MSTKSDDKTKKKNRKSEAPIQEADGRKSTAVEKKSEPAREIITIDKHSYINLQPSLFEPLQETLVLSPVEKDKLRTLLRTIDTGDAWVLKQAFTLLTLNFFSPTKEPEKKIQVVNTDTFRLTFTPSIFGSPTMYDADILMFAVSALAEDIRRNKSDLTKSGTMPYKGIVVFQVKDFSNRIGRSRNARSMQQIKESLDRLSMSSITIESTGKIGNKEVRAGQTIGHFLTDYKFCEIKEPGKKPIAAIQVRLAEWIVRDIAEGRTLWFPDEFFGLTPIEKSIYMIARSHIGIRMSKLDRQNKKPMLAYEDNGMEPDADQPGMTVGNAHIEYFFHSLPLPELHERTRYSGELKKFKALLLKVIRSGNLGSYEVALDERKRMLSQQVVYFFRKDDKLKANIFAAGLKYEWFRETFDALTVSDYLKPMQTKSKRRIAAKKSAGTRMVSKTTRRSTAKKTSLETVDMDPESLFAKELEAFDLANDEQSEK